MVNFNKMMAKTGDYMEKKVSESITKKFSSKDGGKTEIVGNAAPVMPLSRHR